MHLTREQVRKVDQIAIEQFGIPGVVLMENASRGVVEVLQTVRPKLQNEHVAIICGGGNNGGDGLAIARHLANFGARVTVALATDPAKYQGDALINWNIVQRMESAISVTRAQPALFGASDFDAVIDAVFGTGLTQPTRPLPAVGRRH